MCHINDGFVSPTYIKVFGTLSDQATLHILLLRVLEAEFQVPSDCVQAGILPSFYPRLGFVKGDRILDLLVKVHIVTF